MAPRQKSNAKKESAVARGGCLSSAHPRAGTALRKLLVPAAPVVVFHRRPPPILGGRSRGTPGRRSIGAAVARAWTPLSAEWLSRLLARRRYPAVTRRDFRRGLVPVLAAPRRRGTVLRGWSPAGRSLFVMYDKQARIAHGEYRQCACVSLFEERSIRRCFLCAVSDIVASSGLF